MRRPRPMPPRPDSRPPDVPRRPDLPAAPWEIGLVRSRRRRRLIAVAVIVCVVSGAGGAGLVSLLRGPAPEHAFLQTKVDGSPYRWNPCTPIHYVANLAEAPPQAEADLTEALRRVTQASGIAFVNDGTTARSDEAQGMDGFRDPQTGDWYPVLVVWQSSGEFRDYANPERYAGIGMPETGYGPDSATFRSGLIVVNADTGEPTGFSGRFSEGPLLMHEWGHVLGLAHVASGHEIMWSSQVKGAAALPDLSQEDWGPGDLEGLRALGRAAGCIPDPSS